ncbi:MAG TPA: integrin, partial [Kofleriaceae bacterium]
MLIAFLASACGRFDFGSTIDSGTRDGGGGFIGSGQTYVKASNTEANDLFGYAIALSSDGSTLVVTSNGEDSAATGIDGDAADNSAPSAGAAYVYARSGSSWLQQAYVKASNTHAGDVFGVSAALSGDGNTLAVGAFLEPGGSTGLDGDQQDQTQPYSGAVYVYTRSGSTWTQQAYVKASNTGSNDQFGDSVALSGDGNTLAVAAYMEDSSATGIDGNQTDNSANNSGAVYVFARSGGRWSQQAYVKASNTNADDEFGDVTLSADGDVLAVSAPFEQSAATGVDADQTDNSEPNVGAVYVFARTGVIW